jgi:hypothetical protein
MGPVAPMGYVNPAGPTTPMYLSKHGIIETLGSASPPVQLDCRKVAEHIKTCPVCKKLYENSNTVLIFILIIFFLMVIILFLLKKVMNL